MRAGAESPTVQEEKAADGRAAAEVGSTQQEICSQSRKGPFSKRERNWAAVAEVVKKSSQKVLYLRVWANAYDVDNANMCRLSTA